MSLLIDYYFFFFSSRRRHTRWTGDWSSDVCSSDLPGRMSRVKSTSQSYTSAIAQASERRSTAGRNVSATALSSARSEERRVGKECRLRGWPYDLKSIWLVGWY